MCSDKISDTPDRSIQAGPRASAAARPKPFGGVEGFTLIEVLVALTILSIALGIIYSGFATNARGKRTAIDYQRATALAQSTLESMGTASPITIGETTGVFDNRYRWTATVAPFDQNAGGAGDGNTYDEFNLLLVTVTVSWGTDRGRRSIALETIRLQEN